MNNQTSTTTAIDAAAYELAVNAFEHFRDAAHDAGLPLPAINAVAVWKTAADLLFQAHEAAREGRDDEAQRLTGWALRKLVEMDDELSALAAAGERA
jgi:hypothetical protein